MSENKFTPGPWPYNMCLEIWDAGLSRLGDTGALPIGLVLTMQFDGVVEHNARLTHAAPELFEAAKLFVDHYPVGVNPSLDEAYNKARSAIRKATEV